MSTKPKILITGACGDLGHRMVLALKDKYWVVGVDNFSSGKEEYAKDCNEFLKMSVGRIQQSHLYGVKYVIHCAFRNNDSNVEAAHNHNVTFSLLLLEAAKQAGTEGIFYPNDRKTKNILSELQLEITKKYFEFYPQGFIGTEQGILEYVSQTTS